MCIRDSVKDSGIGIPAERVATIFRRFGKVNDFVQGTGLGPVSYTHLGMVINKSKIEIRRIPIIK